MSRNMPYESRDAPRFTKKAKSPKRKRQWKHVVNSALARGASEGSAIRQANAAVKKSVKSRTAMDRYAAKRNAQR